MHCTVLEQCKNINFLKAAKYVWLEEDERFQLEDSMIVELIIEPR